MAIRGGKKLPDKRGFVDGPGGYRGSDDRSHGNSNNNSGSGNGPGSQGPGGMGAGGYGGAMSDSSGNPSHGTNVTNTNPNTGVTTNVTIGTPDSTDPVYNPNILGQYFGYYNPDYAPVGGTITSPSAVGNVPSTPFPVTAINPNLAVENTTQEEGFQGFPALFSGIASTVGDFMNSPLGNVVGMFTNPVGYALGQIGRNIYGAYNDDDEDTGIMSALGNAFQQSTPFGEMSTAIGNPFSGVPNAGELNTTTEVGDTFSMAPQSFFNGLFSNANYGLSPEAQEGMPSTVGVGQRLNEDGTINTGMARDALQDYNNQVAAQEQPGFFGNLFSGLDIQPNDLEAERRANRGSGEIIPSSNSTDLPIEENPFVGYGSINPAANYGLLYGGGFANGGQVPPMSGPMSNGIGTLYKQK